MYHLAHGGATVSGGQRRSISAHYVSRNQDPAHLISTVSEIAHSATESGVTSIIIPENSVIDEAVTPSSIAATPINEENIPGIGQRGRRHSAKLPPPGLEEALAHLAPANLANRPRETTSKTVKIKGAHATTSLPSAISSAPPVVAPQPGQQVVKDYGTIGSHTPVLNGDAAADSAISYADVVKDGVAEDGKGTFSGDAVAATAAKRLQKRIERRGKKARSGSLVERVENREGVRKTVIETTSSSESDDELSVDENAQGKNGERSPLLNSGAKGK